MNVRTNIHSELLEGPFGAALEDDILPAWLPRRRWFRSKSRDVRTVTQEARVPLGEWPHAPLFTILRIDFVDGGTERYALPFVVLPRQECLDFPDAAIIGPVPGSNGESILCDACWHSGFREAWMEVLAGKRACELPGGTLRGRPGTPEPFSASPAPESRVLSAEQSNTSIVYDSGMFVKLYRRLEEGVHPEPEMLRFLREHTDYRGVPGFLSSVEWKTGRHQVFTAALAQEFTSGVDAWSFALASLRPAFEEPSAAVLEDIMERAARFAAHLGTQVGGLHAALGSRPDVQAFAREPLTTGDLEAVRNSARTLLDSALKSLKAASATLPPDTARLAETVRASREKLGALIDRAGRETGSQSGGYKIRTHGDLHLGQMLVNGNDVRILDFEGEPGRPLAAARAKQSPLRDAAGMLRSFHYVAHAASRDAAREAGSPARAAALAEELCAAFLDGYFAAIDQTRLVPADGRSRRDLLDLFVLEKAVYELHYELNNRPDWAGIPLQGLVSLCNDSD